jgi:type I restriction enzyme S subunit
MAGEWREFPFSQAVLLNPPVQLERGSRYPFVDMSAVSSSSRCAYATEEREFSGGGSRFQHGDTLMARITPCLENGKIARFCAPQGSAVGHGSTEFIVVRGRPGITDTDFAYYLTQWEEVRNYAIGQMTGTSGRQRVPTDSLGHLDVPIPPVPEQRAIAHILGTLDDKIELNRRMSETLEQMARALFKSWFVDFDPVRAKMEGHDPGLPKPLADLFPTHFVDSKLGEIPERWKVLNLGDLIELAYGKALKGNDRRDGEVPVYGSNGQVGWHDQRLVQGPGIVVGRKGNPGVVKWAPADFFVIDTAFYVVPKKACRSLHFLFHALQAHDLGSLGADSAVPGLNRNLAYMSAQLLPPQQLVDRFEAYASPLAARAHACDRESRTLAALRDALLPKLISGELRLSAALRNHAAKGVVKDAERVLEIGNR